MKKCSKKPGRNYGHSVDASGQTDSHGTNYPDLRMIKTVSWQDFTESISNNGYYDISSAISNLDYNDYKHFKLHVEISDTNATSPQYEYIYKTDWES